jgi:AmiR/NasT family two-component response regulator
MTARILVVDDIEANVRLLEAKLTAEYYDVISASDGPTALAMAASEKPDIVLPSPEGRRRYSPYPGGADHRAGWPQRPYQRA